MLPTNEKAQITFVKHTQGKNVGKLQIPVAGGEYRRLLNYDFEPQHLYILSDEEIKEGDWVYDKLNNKVYQANSIVIHNMKSMEYEIFLEKIIATTDGSLRLNSVKVPVSSDFTLEQISQNMPCLPQPSQQFIEKFVEEYNKGNVITDIMVEYEELSYQKELDKPIHKGLGVYRFDETVPYNKLKISKDNTITIRKCKESWSREEVLQLLRIAFFRNGGTKIDFDKWIEENL